MSASLFSNTKSVSSCFMCFLHGVLDPLTHRRAALGYKRIVLFLGITSEYCSFSFSASFIAKFLMKRAHSRPMPPFVPNTSGVKVACSISITLSM